MRNGSNRTTQLTRDQCQAVIAKQPRYRFAIPAFVVLGASIHESNQSPLVGGVNDGAIRLFEEVIALHCLVKVASVSPSLQIDLLSLVRLDRLYLFARVVWKLGKSRESGCESLTSQNLARVNILVGEKPIPSNSARSDRKALHVRAILRG